MKTLILAVLTTATLAGPARAGGTEGAPVGVESEIRAQGREALLVIRTARINRIALEHRLALARAGERLRAAGAHVTPVEAGTRIALKRTLAGLKRDARMQFRRPPRHESLILGAPVPDRAIADRRAARKTDFPKRGWAEYPALTPR